MPINGDSPLIRLDKSNGSHMGRRRPDHRDKASFIADPSKVRFPANYEGKYVKTRGLLDAAHRARPSGADGGRRLRPGSRLRGALGGSGLHHPALQGEHEGLLRRCEGERAVKFGASPTTA